MLKYPKIRKRTTNAILHGCDLGIVSAKVEVIVQREEDLHLPKPKFKNVMVKSEQQQIRR